MLCYSVTLCTTVIITSHPQTTKLAYSFLGQLLQRWLIYDNGGLTSAPQSFGDWGEDQTWLELCVCVFKGVMLPCMLNKPTKGNATDKLYNQKKKDKMFYAILLTEQKFFFSL